MWKEGRKMAKIFTWRVWLLVFFIAISILAIKPNPFASGVEVKSISANSLAADNGLKAGMKILKVNDAEINTVSDYINAITYLNKPQLGLKIKTDKATVNVNVTNKLKISLDENLTVIRSEVLGI